VVWRNCGLLHNLVIMLVVLWVFERWPGPLGLLSFLGGLALVLANGVWVALLLGLICARFRDVPPIVGSTMQLTFFITPIIWHPSLLPGRQRVIDWNPFYHFIELVRAPMLGGQVSAVTWSVALGITAAGWIVTFLVLLRYRRRIAYWI
jgi:ABC-type polysaccharide/polyol phosphate export permease